MTIKTLNRQAVDKMTPYFITAANHGKFENRSASGLVYRFDIRPEDVEVYPELRDTTSVWLGFCTGGNGQ